MYPNPEKPENLYRFALCALRFTTTPIVAARIEASTIWELPGTTRAISTADSPATRAVKTCIRLLSSDLVTLNILTKYFITIRYNLNKILLS